MKAFSLIIFTSFSLQVLAKDISNESPGAICAAIGCEDGSFGKKLIAQNEVAKEEGKNESNDDFKAERDALREKFKAVRDERKTAMEAARKLEGEAKVAAIKAAEEKFKAAIAPLRLERKALREKYHLASANRADKILKGNAKKNEEVSRDILVADKEPQVEEAPPKVTLRASAPAVQSEQKLNNARSSRVSAE